MSELENMINSVLSDPAQMEKISGLARSLMGGAEQPSSEKPVNMLDSLMSGGSPGPELDPAMLRRISALMGASDSGSSDKRALLEAMKPYLSEKRRQKMDRALRIARLAKIAGIAMGEMEGKGDV